MFSDGKTRLFSPGPPGGEGRVNLPLGALVDRRMEGEGLISRSSEGSARIEAQSLGGILELIELINSINSANSFCISVGRIELNFIFY